jgi:protein SCO1
MRQQGQIGARCTQARAVVAHGAHSVALWLAALVLLAAAVATSHAEALDPHAHHHYASPGSKRTVLDYAVPSVKLVRDDGKVVQLNEEIDDGRPVVLSFIYTSCTTVCPVTSQTLAQLQSKLGPARELVHMVSITIDPEFDTPARLHDYAARFGAGPQWQHYTGTLPAVQTAQRAFGVYRGNKMEHAPVTLVRGVPGAQWVRIDGFATADQLMAELSDVCITK